MEDRLIYGIGGIVIGAVIGGVVVYYLTSESNEKLSKLEEEQNKAIKRLEPISSFISQASADKAASEAEAAKVARRNSEKEMLREVVSSVFVDTTDRSAELLKDIQNRQMKENLSSMFKEMKAEIIRELKNT